MKIKITIITLLLIVNSLLAQEDNWQLTLVSGDTISNVSLQYLVGDSLAIFQSGQTSWINVGTIFKIRKIVESEFLKDAGVGALLGAGVVALVATATYHKTPGSINLGSGVAAGGGAVVGLLSGFIVGGIVGAANSKDVVYDLSDKSLKDKLKIIRTIIVNE